MIAMIEGQCPSGGELREGKCNLCHVKKCCPLNYDKQICLAWDSGATFCCWRKEFYYLCPQQRHELREEITFMWNAKCHGNIYAIDARGLVEGSEYHKLVVIYQNVKGDNDKLTVTYGFWDETVRDLTVELLNQERQQLLNKERQHDIEAIMQQIACDMNEQCLHLQELQSGTFEKKEDDMTIHELVHRASECSPCDIDCNCKIIRLDIVCPNIVKDQLSKALTDKATLVAWDFREGNDGCVWLREEQCDEHVHRDLIHDNGNDVVSNIYRRGSIVLEGLELFFLEIVFGGCCKANWKFEFMVFAYTSKSARDKGEEEVRRLVRKTLVRVRCRLCGSA